MNATDLALLLHLRKPKGHPTEFAPGGVLPTIAPAAPATTGLPAHVRAAVLHRLTEYGSCCKDEIRATHLKYDTDAEKARDLQRTYAAEIVALLQGDHS